MRQIIDCIREYRNGDSDATLYIIDRLKPLLNKYAYKLSYEDAYCDLQMFVFDCLAKVDFDGMNNNTNGAIIKYFEKALYNEYIRLSKVKDYIGTYEIFEDEDISIIDYVGGREDDHSNLMFESLKSYLNDKEFEVIYNMYYENMSAKDISHETGQSVWNVYKLRDNAIAKLRKYIDK